MVVINGVGVQLRARSAVIFGWVRRTVRTRCSADDSVTTTTGPFHAYG